MQPVVWNPLREMDDLFHSLRRGFGRGMPAEMGKDMANWAPAVDISEKETEYLIKGELPGVKREDVDISVDNGILTLSGERRFEKEDKDEKHHRVERSYGGFSRSFALPENVAIEQISADYQDGVVTVHLPKVAKTKAETKKITVT
ncbi:Hsp20/alpha crystallin family protein [Sinimarinibacterium sp. CAU 1509]|uniref:Hsp20/alpha crystallin family protein n=1 Tax=Sinimarinibacterium sp. CAU 1509 TaxID=2562283 RepID=UPI0010AC5422|nr:Hsp20/alpha crystallin family protein [Sinimarinibacterium sp. CAU 1509]TJY62992.1 Hsp20/alpha crystallin family protein [Sinimarinibacterium sp. CAU 1509]